MVQLPEPDHQVAKSVLQTVAYRDRFEAGRMMKRTGICPIAVRSLHQLRMLLVPKNDTLPGINFEILAQWFRSSLGDDALADAVLIAIGETKSYVECCMVVNDLVQLRLAQARAVNAV